MRGLSIAALALLWAAPAAAQDEPVQVRLNGDLKAFTLVTFPYDNDTLAALGVWPEDPQGQGILDGRLKLQLRGGERWRFEAHHAVSTVVGSAITLGSSGAALTAPELFDLTWTTPEDGGSGTTVQGRTDRLLLQGEFGPVTVALGRQPLSFGSGMFYTPLDLVSPFFPGTIDSEYKPGVDAAQVSIYSGYSFEQRLVVAWVGDCSLVGGGEPSASNAGNCARDDTPDAGVEDLAVASWTRVTVGVSDLALFLGEVHDDEVVGLSVVTAVGPVGLHGDASLTLPPGHLDGRDPTEDPFVRAVVGADWRPGSRTTLSGEAYVQSNGATDPADYLAQAQGDRYLRGELWALGRSYVGLSWAQELRPTITSSLAVIANVEDPSAMVIPGVNVSVADNADLSAGAYLGLGKRPEGLTFRSELGFLPTTAYARMAMYF